MEHRPDRKPVRIPSAAELERSVEPQNIVRGIEYRTFNGTNNDLQRRREGAAFVPLVRMAPPAYGPGNSLARQEQVSAREISNSCNHQSAAKFNERSMSDFVWQWGQFLDHDLDLTEFQHPVESAPIQVPLGDAFFDPLGTGTSQIGFSRSLHFRLDLSISKVRQQINEITAWIDGSNVYGSSKDTADSLRTFVDGKLRTSDGGKFGDLLPLNKSGTQFVAGDIRAGEQAGLSCMHTLFMREHNRLAALIKATHPNLDDEEIYQRARSEVIAILESITFNEWLPALMGEAHVPADYQGYDPEASPNIANEFSTAAFRFGHTMLNNQLLRLQDNGEVIAEGNILLRNAFFNPAVVQSVGIDPYLRGMMSQRAQEIDTELTGAVRNFLFANQPESPAGFDLAALNIQRGRDHGLPDFNTVRISYGLPPLNSFAELTSNPLAQAKLASVYDSVDVMDPWVGFLAEDHAPGSSLGPTAIAALREQFERIRDADRFWYERIYTGDDLDRIQKTTLANVIRRNTGLTNVPKNVFFAD